MRIALVIERFEPAAGGMENAAWQVAHGLAEAGDEVHVIARRGSETPAATLHRVGDLEFWQPLRVLAFSRAVRREVRRGDFDLVHAFSRTRHQDIYRAGGGSHADYMLRAYSATGARLRRLTPRHALLLGLERHIFADPSQTIQCGSRMVRDEIASRFRVPADRLEVIHNGVDCRHFHARGDAAERDSLRRRFGAGGAPVWLLAGSGWQRKGLDTALAAVAAAPGRDSQLWVAGRDAPGPWRASVEKLGLAERVQFLGPQPDMAPLYRASDALLLPTRYDAFANVCLEAAACGLAVVTSGANGCAELLAEAGLVVEDPEDAAGFGAALERLADPSLRAELGSAGRQLAEAHSWPAHIDKLRALYRRIGTGVRDGSS